MISSLLGTWSFLQTHPLTAHQPMQALSRYVRWQLGSRVLHAPVAIDFVNDARLLVRHGMTGATGNIYAGLHEFADMAFVLHALRPNDLFVDVGANIGSYTILAAKAVGARVVCFEPVATTYSALVDNIRLNGVEQRVNAHQACVGHVAGTARMTVGLDTTNHVLTVDHVAGESSATVPCVRLDDVLAGEAPFAMKMDVEGYELEVLRGGEGVLRNPGLQAIVMEINTAGERYSRSDDELEALVLANGFERVAYSPLERRLVSAAGEVPAGAGNAIFVRDRSLVEERLRAAPPFRVLGRSI